MSRLTLLAIALLLAATPPSGAQEIATAASPRARLAQWGAGLPMDPGVGREMTRFRNGSLEAAFVQEQAGRIREALLDAAESAVQEWSGEGCRPRVDVSFPEPESWGGPQLASAERAFLSSLVRTEAVACFQTGMAPSEALRLLTSPAFRREAESRIERIWEEGEAFCYATGGVPLLLSPTAICNRIHRLEDGDLAAEHSQVIRNDREQGLQPMYFKESLKTFMATEGGLAFHYVNYSRSVDLGRASRWIAGGELRESQTRQMEALRSRMGG